MDDRDNDLSSSKKMFNVLAMGMAFLLMFTGFQTCGMVEQTVLNSYINDTKTADGEVTYHGSGYISLAIIYIVFAFANWIAPSVVSLIGPKYSMFLGGITYTLYLATFIKPLTPTLYIGSVLVGFGAAILWTGQGNFLTLNSDDETMGRNSGIFWAMLQCSLLIGNIYVFFSWQGVTNITEHQRVPLFIGLTAVCGCGTFLVLVLRSQHKSPRIEEDREQLVSSGSNDDRSVDGSDVTQDSASLDDKGHDSKLNEALQAFLTSIRLFVQPEMLLLSITFFYTGLELTFFSGVYSTCVGATKQFGSDSDKLVGLTGIMIGVGEISGGAIFGIFGKKTIRYGRDPVVLLGGFVHLVTFFLIFLNIPDEAPIMKATLDTAYIDPNKDLAIACGFLLGFADACFNTQCYSIIGSTYPKKSAPAFALFKFEQSFAAAVGFFYSSYISLKWQLLILVVFGFGGTLTFFKVERKVRQVALDANSVEYPDI
ncbi:UNC93-like protein MFSD11 [Clavelina lepadiformis]|uniref:UNC93-like protein MFSD11 n=1 Tax=Clavelina lepadiformis TaxID=159417 RepID=UPI004042E740